ncbi:MAG: tRNA pseudouridine(38-40) synthase TruA [Spirochaetales bacterium]|nr:tRNA pseudouridine(38-40) synthase TruA [Spirochaetales bacterium]
MIKRSIRLDLSYDGTDFSGWQRQHGVRSVQEALESALAKMHGHPVPVTGAGRTDAGVHAARQVAHFRSDIASIPAERFRPALDRLLPRDVRVLSASEADPDFHARYDARSRSYRYFVDTSPYCPPWRARYAWHLRRVPDTGRLQSMARALRGELDFTTYSSAKDPAENRSRYVHRASWRAEGDGLLVFEVEANAFLWRMVRSLVGSMIELEAAGGGGDEFRAALDARDRARAGATAPARGLFLWNVDYYPTPTRRGRAVLEDGAEGPDGCDGTEGGSRLVPGIGYIEE